MIRILTKKTKSTEWTLSLDFTESKCGIKFVYDQIDMASADMCFSNIIVTRSVY